VAATITLQSYLTQCQRLLHDATGAFFSQSELTSYINDARYRLCRDTACLRQYQTDAAIKNQELYTFATLPNGAHTYDVMNINLIWGNTRVPLYYLPWTDFNAKLRYWTNYIGRPIAWSFYNASDSYYLGPVPDQNYVTELDTSVVPAALVNTTDVDTIQDVYTSPVAFYAAHLAKYKEQAFGEAEIFLQMYNRKMLNVRASTYTRRMFSPYATAYGYSR
jgi:hypothetical protein